MKVEKSIEISAAPEKIWPFLVDPAKIVMWFDTYKKCEYTSEKHSGVGTTYYIEEKVPGPL
ncbi:MAG: SRPBCC family protein, partial [Desulfobacteraceae bacterium]|nr:SRPBCC family protein [Desulfobacteraceae bacterium]